MFVIVYSLVIMSTKDSKLVSYQLTIYATMFIGYACYAYNRKSVSLAMPKLMEEGLTKSDAGLIASSQNLAYAISKFLGGILSDRMSSKLLFSTGLLMSGVATLAFASNQDSVTMFAALWFLNGFAQGCGWPACAKVLRQWFAPEQFGTYWSFLSASANISGGVSPFLAAFIIPIYGWRFSLMVAGSVSIGLGVIALFTITNSPTDIGLPSFAPTTTKVGSKQVKRSATVGDLLSSPFLWLVSFCYMVVFCAKTSTVDWGQMYLMEDRGHTQYVGSAFTSSVETGGFFGGVLAGYLTDWSLKRASRKKVSGNPRMPVAILFMSAVAGLLYFLHSHVNSTSSQLLITSLGFALGASLYGPIAIYGVVATESSPPHLSGTAHAVVALAANVGAISSGLPFSYMATYYGWSAIFLFLPAITSATVLVMILTRNMNSQIGRIKGD